MKNLAFVRDVRGLKSETGRNYSGHFVRRQTERKFGLFVRQNGYQIRSVRIQDPLGVLGRNKKVDVFRDGFGGRSENHVRVGRPDETGVALAHRVRFAVYAVQVFARRDDRHFVIVVRMFASNHVLPRWM